MFTVRFYSPLHPFSTLLHTHTHTHTHTTRSPQPGTSESYDLSSSVTFSKFSYQCAARHPGQGAYQDQANIQPHCSISFDTTANLSTSDDMREFYLHQGPGQCAESRYPLEQCGGNYTDHPLAPVSSRMGDGFPPTNGTPPDDVNPMVCAPSNYHPYSNGLPGVGLGRAMAPVTAMTDEAENKGLTLWHYTGFLLPNMLGGQLTDSLRNPIQQVSDFDHIGGLNRHQACYIQPTRKVNNYCKDHGPFSPSELPDVLVEGFPYAKKYSNIDEGILIYCSEVNNFLRICCCTTLRTYFWVVVFWPFLPSCVLPHLIGSSWPE